MKIIFTPCVFTLESTLYLRHRRIIIHVCVCVGASLCFQCIHTTHASLCDFSSQLHSESVLISAARRWIPVVIVSVKRNSLQEHGAPSLSRGWSSDSRSSGVWVLFLLNYFENSSSRAGSLTTVKGFHYVSLSSGTAIKAFSILWSLIICIKFGEKNNIHLISECSVNSVTL